MTDSTTSKKKRSAQSRTKRAQGATDGHPVTDPQSHHPEAGTPPEGTGGHLELIDDTDGGWEHAEKEAMTALDEKAQAEPEQVAAASARGGDGDVDWSSLTLESRGRRAGDQEIASFLRFTGGRFPSLLQPVPPNTHAQEDAGNEEDDPGTTD